MPPQDIEKIFLRLNFCKHLLIANYAKGRKREYTKAGESLMYGLVKTARENNANFFELTSISKAVPFYTGLGMKNNRKEMSFDSIEMDNFILKTENKFNQINIPKQASLSNFGKKSKIQKLNYKTY
ncbi:MAG: hypothetical protein MZU91_05860 [Desulfosudis oleivorans]|nr:hypothetical protein [Desulfosudis oleivorans]